MLGPRNSGEDRRKYGQIYIVETRFIGDERCKKQHGWR